MVIVIEKSTALRSDLVTIFLIGHKSEQWVWGYNPNTLFISGIHNITLAATAYGYDKKPLILKLVKEYGKQS
jgi:hypothetical protein